MSPTIRAMAAVVLLLQPIRGAASNYFLEQLSTLVSRAEVKRLQHAGVHTTDELVLRGATSAARLDLSRLTGIPPQRLLWLGSLSDLMRLRGVGPDAARLIDAAGCHGIAELQQADPQLLADEIRRVNDHARLSKNPPRADNLTAWILQARQIVLLYQPEAPAPSEAPR